MGDHFLGRSVMGEIFRVRGQVRRGQDDPAEGDAEGFFGGFRRVFGSFRGVFIGEQPSLTRTHYSAGYVSALLTMPPKTRSAAQKRHLDAFLRLCPKAHELRRFVLQFRAIEMAKCEETGYMD
jgi:hypothetical protein